jgi:hypothetical protein
MGVLGVAAGSDGSSAECRGGGTLGHGWFTPAIDCFFLLFRSGTYPDTMAPKIAIIDFSSGVTRPSFSISGTVGTATADSVSGCMHSLFSPVISSL